MMFFIFLVFEFYTNSKDVKILHEKGILGEAYIYKLEQTTRSFILHYKFNYNGIEYEGKYNFSSWEKRGDRLVYKYYPVVFDPSNPSNSTMLFFNRDFEYYKISIPDSIFNR